MIIFCFKLVFLSKNSTGILGNVILLRRFFNGREGCTFLPIPNLLTTTINIHLKRWKFIFLHFKFWYYVTAIRPYVSLMRI
jgi:hypothetical protein